MKAEDYIRKLHRKGHLLGCHVQAAAKFEKLVYSGYSSQSLKLERVDCDSYQVNLSGLILGRLSSDVSATLMSVIIYENSLISIGLGLGASTRTGAYRLGLKELYRSLDIAYNRLC